MKNVYNDKVYKKCFIQKTSTINNVYNKKRSTSKNFYCNKVYKKCLL